MLNPAHIDLFRAVVKHGGITKAATSLGIGQPHVSRSIAKLEADLGFQLFIRGRGGAFLTLEGEAFAHEVLTTYVGLDHLFQTGRQIKELGSGPLRIACQPSLAARLLPMAIRGFKITYPGVRIAIHVPTPDLIWSWVSSGQCDIGLVRPRAGYSGVVVAPFMNVNAVCAMHKSHPLSSKSFIAPADLKDAMLIAGAPGDFQQAVESVFARAGIPANFPIMAQYTSARCGLVGQNLGLAIVDPVAAVELRDPDIILKPFRPFVDIETVLIRSSLSSNKNVDPLISLLYEMKDRLLEDS